MLPRQTKRTPILGMISISGSIRAALAALLLAGAAGCSSEDQSRTRAAHAATPCDAPAHLATLPHDLREASGIAVSRTHEGVLWVIDDENPWLYALDRSGRELGRVRVPSRVRDWEDLALAPCGDRDCLYIGDFGDNQHRRDDVAILRVPEPSPGDRETAEPQVFRFRYPNGPGDAEALFILEGERLYIVSKGRNGPVALFRFPPLVEGSTLTLEHVRDFTPGLVQLPDMVTGADATPNGRWVAIRSYGMLELWAVEGGELARERTARVPLGGLREPQGEGVAITDAGEVLLVSERARRESAPLSRLHCRLD